VTPSATGSLNLKLAELAPAGIVRAVVGTPALWSVTDWAKVLSLLIEKVWPPSPAGPGRQRALAPKQIRSLMLTFV
jgi:hypothetical protein